MNKKAILMLNYLIWIMRFIFLSILVVSIGVVVAKYINIKVDISGLESAIILQRIASTNAIMYQDKATFRTYPTIIDTTKIQDTEALNNEINFGKNVRHLTAEVITGDKKNYLNKRLFDELKENLKTIFVSDVRETKQQYATPEKMKITVLQQR